MTKPQPSGSKEIDRRESVLRRDINELVRDPRGKVSAGKVGSLIGQFIVAKYLLVHDAELINKWETLTILLSVLVAPELLKKLMTMKYGGTVTSTTASAEVTTTRSR